MRRLAGPTIGNAAKSERMLAISGCETGRRAMQATTATSIAATSIGGAGNPQDDGATHLPHVSDGFRVRRLRAPVM